MKADVSCRRWSGCPPTEEDGDGDNVAWDDVDGRDLDPVKVKKARQEEVKFYKDMDTFEEVPIEERRREN